MTRMRVTSAQILPNCPMVVGFGGWGILGADLPDEGDHGASVGSRWVTLPGDAASEIWVRITSDAPSGTLLMYPDSSFEYDGASTTFSAQLAVGGTDVGTPQTITLNVGEVASGSASGGLDSVALQPVPGAASGTTVSTNAQATGALAAIDLVEVGGWAGSATHASAQSGFDFVSLSTIQATTSVGYSGVAVGQLPHLTLDPVHAAVAYSAQALVEFRGVSLHRPMATASTVDRPTPTPNPTTPPSDERYRTSGYVLAIKDVGETYLLSLDIRHLTSNPVNPVVTCFFNPKSPRRGETSPQEMLVGEPSVTDGHIHQKVVGGDPDAKYVIQASIEDSVTGEVFVETWLLRVARRLNSPL